MQRKNKLYLQIITMFLFAFMLLPFAGRVFADPAPFAYTLTYYDDHAYNLVTGATYANESYIVTNKIPIIEDTILPESADFHYILFYGVGNSYLGYLKAGGWQEIAPAYLGDYVTGTVAIPEGAKTYALMANKDGVNTFTNLPKPGGGYYTYEEIFTTPSYGAYDDETITIRLDEIFSNPSYLDYVTASGLTLDEIFTATRDTVSNMAYDYGALMDAVDDFAYNSVTTLQLKNMIRNGDMTEDADDDGYPDYFSDYGVQMDVLLNDFWRVGFTTSDYTGPRQDWPVWMASYTEARNKSYYFGANAMFSTLNTSTASLLINDGTRQVAANIPKDNTWHYIYNVITMSAVATNFYMKIQPQTRLQDYLYTDNWFLIDITGTGYTTTQINAALSYYGYLPYNTELYLPDVNDYDFSHSGEGGTKYIIRGTQYGTNTELIDYDIFNNSGMDVWNVGGATEWESFDNWRAVYGDRNTTYWETITGFNTSLIPDAARLTWYGDDILRDYEIGLYWDAYDSIDRVEWYEWAGITSGNYDYYYNLAIDALNLVDRFEWYTWAGVTSLTFSALQAEWTALSGIDLFDLSGLDVYYLYEAPIELTTIEKINAFFSDELGLDQMELAGIGLSFIVALIIITYFIGSARGGAPSVWVYLIECMPFLVFFLVLGWFPAAAGLFIIMTLVYLIFREV